MLEQAHLFFLPTHGENFGHAIAEAFAAGVPVLISDTTPWRDLRSSGVGWDLSLDEPQCFVEAIEMCANMDSDAYSAMRIAARRFSLEALQELQVQESRRMFINVAFRSALGSETAESNQPIRDLGCRGASRNSDLRASSAEDRFL